MDFALLTVGQSVGLVHTGLITESIYQITSLLTIVVERMRSSRRICLHEGHFVDI